MTTRPKGVGSAEMSSPWYRRVGKPATVPEAKPPSPFVTSHSRPIVGAGSRRSVAAKVAVRMTPFLLIPSAI
jgi:hypothetical protein